MSSIPSIGYVLWADGQSGLVTFVMNWAKGMIIFVVDNGSAYYAWEENKNQAYEWVGKTNLISAINDAKDDYDDLQIAMNMKETNDILLLSIYSQTRIQKGEVVK